jgi:sulfatase modifying factor 1
VKPVIVERVNSIGMRFALVSPGRFLMGSPPEEAERSEDEKPHEVDVTRAFWLGVFAVTQRQWQTVMGNNPSWFCAGGEGAGLVKGKDTDDFPVETVSWEDAQEFLKKLNALADKTNNPLTYRLPSEAQWEYACRGGPTSSSKPFHFEHPTDSLSCHQANFNGKYPYGGAGKRKPLKRTCKVGSYRPNRLGLYDVHGNVFEWCADWYGDYPQGPVVDPLGTPGGSYRVLRGGSWYDFGRRCRAALRGRDAPSDRGSDLGFRVAAVPHE